MLKLRPFVRGNFVRSAFLLRAATNFTQKIPRVFVYHRFCKSKTSEQNANCIDQDTFEWQLNQLRKGWEIIRLKDYWKLLQRGEAAQRVAIITIDDGYKDFYDFAFPLLKKYELTATFFPTVEFVNGNLWLWPDRLKYMLDNTHNPILKVRFEGRQFEFHLLSKEDRARAWHELSDFCVSIKNHERINFLLELKKHLNFIIPESPPSDYAPVSWDQLEEMLSYGIEIGCHTMSHPILSRITEKQLRREVTEAKIEMEQRLNTEIISFCYPNSAPGDINEAVVQAVRNAGFKIAVFGTNLTTVRDQFQIPRMGVSPDRVDFLWKLCGMEALVMHGRQIL